MAKVATLTWSSATTTARRGPDSPPETARSGASLRDHAAAIHSAGVLGMLHTTYWKEPRGVLVPPESPDSCVESATSSGVESTSVASVEWSDE